MSNPIMTRKEVYELIDSERDYQDNYVTPGFAANMKPNDPEFEKLGEPYDVAEEVLMIQSYASALPNLFTQNSGYNPTLVAVRKIAALCVRCMEYHGAPTR